MHPCVRHCGTDTQSVYIRTYVSSDKKSNVKCDKPEIGSTGEFESQAGHVDASIGQKEEDRTDLCNLVQRAHQQHTDLQCNGRTVNPCAYRIYTVIVQRWKGCTGESPSPPPPLHLRFFFPIPTVALFPPPDGIRQSSMIPRFQMNSKFKIAKKCQNVHT